MKDNTAKDLIALSCIAFQRNDLDNAAKLFTLAMNCPDSGEFVSSLYEDNVTGLVLAESLSNCVPDQDLGSIASSMHEVMKGIETQRKRQALRSDAEDFDDLGSQSMEEDDEEISLSSNSVRSPLSIKLK